MDAKRKSTNSPGAGGATDSSRSQSRARGKSVVTDAKQTTNLRDLGSELDNLLASAPQRTYVPTCAVTKTLAQLDPETAEKMRQLIDHSKHQSSVVAELLSRYGFAVAYTTINRHRKRLTGSGCRCPK